jgi:aspartyl-tRNA(Asn)/glutamyl-tRNA(Gln) amidotransferase subunit C
MPQTEKASRGDLLRVAELANLELTEHEEASMLRDLNSILDHVAQLNELGTSSVPAMAQVGEVLGGDLHSSTTWRDDEVVPCLDRSRVLAAAPDSDGTFFRVPKVIDR